MGNGLQKTNGSGGVKRAPEATESGVRSIKRARLETESEEAPTSGYTTQERLYTISIKEVLEELPKMSWEERQQLRTRLDSEDFRIGDASLSASQILDRPGSPFPLDVVTNLAGLEIMQRVLSGELPPLPGSASTRI
jgi:hypothetical protein